MEIAYEMDFSLPGFIVCCVVLGFGIFEATSLELSKKESSIKSEYQSNGILCDDFYYSFSFFVPHLSVRR
ncbi:hypothetical protein Bca4012_040701 [Brassica carinata]|uniref:Uncharacterized protein n=1 Tax=Brassica carinata TaxID=52824 RepID=A0A8X7QZN4_BRACI|nr:hypothetical protein Bca52824_061532 [Brassica carinata]